MGRFDDRVDTHGCLGGLASVAGLLWMAKAADHGTDRSVDCSVSAARASGLSDGLRHSRADPVPVRALVRPRLGVRGNHELWPGGILLLGGFLLLGRHPSSVIFVSLGTLTGSYAVDRLARGWYYLGGQNGIPSISTMTLGSYEFEEGAVFYYLALAFLIVVYLLCRFLTRSQFGLALAGLRENEQRISFFGYKVQHLKAIIFSLSGAIAGLAGSLYAFHEG